MRRFGKYNAKRVMCDGYTFHSKREAARYLKLAIEQRVGIITDLCLQVPYVLAPAVVIAGRKRPPMRYVADFTYLRDGIFVVEDVKAVITEGYRIKRHLMKSVHGIDILET
jgi:hypothetical protein